MKILLAVDGSEAALATVRHALALVGNGLRAEFLLVNVQEPASLYEVVVAHDAAVIEQVSAGAAEHALAPAVALLQAARCSFETEVGHGDPAHVLIDILESSGCDAAIVGAHGIAAGSGGAPGRVATWVLHHASVPVTIVTLPAP
jgi:nucleotide-binding universal stress UspA family protein